MCVDWFKVSIDVKVKVSLGSINVGLCECSRVYYRIYIGGYWK